jgi:peptidoglycan/LPS O-acetylase OafA/YrhL
MEKIHGLARGKKEQRLRHAYQPSLDGWRAVSILAVLLYHDNVRRAGLISTSPIHGHGNLGVDLFFAISGYLIVTRLLEEESFYGRFSIHDFYVRRAFRILPAALAYVAAACILALLGWMPATLGGVMAAIFFVRNFYNVYHHSLSTWSLGHFWSLSIEEQFYCFLPGLLLWLRPVRLRAILLLVATAFFLVLAAVDPNPMRVYGILFASAWAVLLRVPAFRIWCVRFLRPFVVAIALAVCAVLFHVVRLGFADHLLLLAFTPIILSTTLHPKCWSCRVLELAPLRYVGRLSYSIYLWQQIFFFDERTLPGQAFHWSNRFPWSYVATAACALGCFYLIERPMIRFGRRFAKPRIESA